MGVIKLNARRGLFFRISHILIGAGLLFLIAYNAENYLSREVKVLLFFIFVILVFCGFLMVVLEFLRS